MDVLHFIGSEARGGNVRFAEITHQKLIGMGVNSELLRVGEPPTPSRVSMLKDGAANVFIHAGGESLSREQLGNLRKIVGCRLIAFAHNPQVPKNWDLFDTVVPVSEYVRQTLLSSGMQTTKIFNRPAYLPASHLSGDRKANNFATYTPIQNSEYEWNSSKVRDYFFGYFDKIGFRPWRNGNRTLLRWDELHRKNRIRLGMVSRIARAKQFPELFRLLHDSLADASDMVEIHIFGSGPWSQIQELKSSFPSSIRPHVFFWGWQEDPWACLPKIHALLLGMPEKEALGLNILEATMRKIPVIGIEGGPFPEVIESGRNGWLLSKNNIHGDFCRVIYELEKGHSKCSFKMTKDYNYRFSEERFEEIMLDLLNA